jgi:nucleotide-binding universal stress UspA family protein
MKRKILVATNGFEGNWPAIEYSAWLGSLLNIPVKLIGVIEPRDIPNIDEETHPLETMFSRAFVLYRTLGVEYQPEIHEGHAEEIIPIQVSESDCLAVLSPLGRPPLRRLLERRSFHHFMAAIPSPILYVPKACAPPERILICLGGLGYGLTVENLGLEIAEKSGASITLMHVVPLIDMDYPESHNVLENWDHLEDTDTLVGSTLRTGLEMGQNAHLDTKVKIRRGNVIEEILTELKEGDYGLVCMGSQYSASGIRQYYTPNVTAEVAEAAGCPVLTARAEQKK